MRVCIFGSRTIKDRSLLDAAMEAAALKGIVPTIVVSGTASGVDTLGEEWARARGIPIEPYEADWSNLDAPNAIIRSRNGVLYNAKAGADRNEIMAERSEAGVCIWSNGSSGTKHMIETLRRLGKPVHVEYTEPATGLFDNRI